MRVIRNVKIDLSKFNLIYEKKKDEFWIAYILGLS